MFCVAKYRKHIYENASCNILIPCSLQLKVLFFLWSPYCKGEAGGARRLAGGDSPTTRYLGRVSHVISEHQFIITIIQFQIQCSSKGCRSWTCSFIASFVPINKSSHMQQQPKCPGLKIEPYSQMPCLEN